MTRHFLICQAVSPAKIILFKQPVTDRTRTPLAPKFTLCYDEMHRTHGVKSPKLPSSLYALAAANKQVSDTHKKAQKTEPEENGFTV